MATDTMLELKRACISGIVPDKAGLMARRFSRLLGISLKTLYNWFKFEEAVAGGVRP